MKSQFLFAQVLCAPLAAPVEINRLNLNKVAYANLIDGKALYLSTFDFTPIIGKDNTFVIKDVSNFASGQKDVEVTKLGGKVNWPNFVQSANEQLFGEPGVLISGGFLLPGRTHGAIYFSSRKNGTIGTQIELFRGNNYFYHQTEAYDVNGDGKLDLISCRANKPLFPLNSVNGGKGDLVWLEPRDRSKPLGKWKEYVIGKGCDTFFKLEDIDGDGYKEIIAAEFWGGALTLIKSNKGRFDDYSKLQVISIDKSLGPSFSVEYVDLNGDGIKDLLASNHVGDGDKAGVFAYEIPKNLTGKWVRRDLAVGFPVLQPGQNQAAPGAAQTFYPFTNQTSGKPHIVVSGDGSQRSYILSPNSESTNDWTFSATMIHDCKATVGGIAFGDANNDGKTEIYIPCYDNSYLVTLSY